MSVRLQDPGETRTYSNEWAADLSTENSPAETVDTRQWTIDPDASPSLLEDAAAETVTVSDLDAGTVYRLTEQVTTTEGRVLEKAIIIRCEER